MGTKKRLITAITALVLIAALAVPMLSPSPALAATTTLNPNAAGNATNLSRSGSYATNWGACSTSDGDTSYVYRDSGDTYYTDTYALPDPVSPTGTISSVTVYMEAKRESLLLSPQASARTVMRIDSADNFGTAETLTTSYATYSTTYTTKPGGAAWTWTDVNNLEVGVSLRSCSQWADRYSRCTHVWVVVDYTPAPAPGAPTLYDTGGTEQLSFNNVKQHTTTPRFRVSATHTADFDRFQIELNDQANFGGTSYTQTFSGNHSSGTQYNLLCNGLSPNLPTTDGQTYYVRARASADGGSNWGPWSSGTWSFTYNAADEDPMWFQTTDEQFDTGTLSDTETSGSDSVQINQQGLTVDLVGSWDTDSDITNGASYTPESGSNRVVLVMVTAESNASGTIDFGSVTLGGQTLTAIENANGVNVGTGGDYHNSVWLGYLDESGIGNMSGSSLVVNWDTSPNNPFGNPKAQFATYENVNQTTPIADSNSNSDTSAGSIQAGSVSVGTGDRLVYATVSGDVENHSPPAGYTEHNEIDGSGNDHSNASAHRDATTSSTEDPVADWSGTNRLAIISAVLNSSGPPSSGTITSPPIDFGSLIGATDWNQLLFADDETSGDIKYDVEYWDGDSWELTSITNQDSSPVDISSLDPATHNPIRIKATLTAGSTPYLQDWTVSGTLPMGLVANFNSTSPQCYCTNITFTDTTTGGVKPYTWDWDFGDATAHSSAQNATHHYAAPATYNVTLTVTDCDTPPNSDTHTDTVTVYATPVVDVTKDGDLTCTDTSVLLTAVTTNTTCTIDSYQWYTGSSVATGIIISGETGSTYSTSSPGDYTCEVTCANGCKAEDFVNVSQDTDAPVVDVTKDGDLTCTDTSVLLTAVTTNTTCTIDSYQWYTGSSVATGIIISGETGSTYSTSSPGDYTCLVTCTNGCKAEDFVNVSQDVDAPVVDVTKDGDLTCTDTSVLLTAVTTNTTCTIDSYQWYTGSSVATGIIISGETGSTYSTSSPGLYTCVVTCTSGCKAEDFVNVTQDIAVPSVNAGADKKLTCTVTEVTLDATVSGGTTPYTYSWKNSANADMGATEDINVISPDTYTLTVTGANGCSSSDSVVVTQDIASPTADFTFSPPICSIYPGDTVTFTDGTTGGSTPYTYDWDFGDGSPHSSAQNPTHAYASGGDYPVTLMVTGENGCEDSVEKTVTVHTACTITGYKYGCDGGNCTETGIEAWTIYLEQPAGTVIRTTTTGTGGYYEFTGLPPGDYTVREDLPEGWEPCTPTSVEVTLGAGQNTVVSNPTDTYYWNGAAWTPSVAAWEPTNDTDPSYWDDETKPSHDFSTSGADWVWESYRVNHPIAGDVVEFKHEFDIPGTPTAGTLYITVDNGYEVYLNGSLVGSAQVHDSGGTDWEVSNLSESWVNTSDWSTVEDYDVLAYLVPGTNVLEITAANEYMGPDYGDGQENGTTTSNPGGVIYELTYGYDCEFNVDFCNWQLGSITIQKVTEPDGGAGFNFTGTGPTGFPPTGCDLDSFTLDDDGEESCDNLAPGTYIITESSLAGWDLTNISCSGDATVEFGDGATFPHSSFVAGDTSIRITLDTGESTTCTFTNEERVPPASIDIYLTKTATDGAGHKITEAYVGDTIVYVFEVLNTGNVDFTSVLLTDDTGICNTGTMTGPTGDNGDGKLNPSEIWTYTCSHVVTAGDPDPLDNQATVSGTPSVPPAEPGTQAIAEATSRVRIIIGEGPTPVGGTVVPVDKAAILAPWIALFAAIAIGAIIL